uniref:Uncharacterized protein n=1 Tax=Arundo donax TaxID=35708 RepID=A0A0A9A4U3_ARUDO
MAARNKLGSFGWINPQDIGRVEGSFFSCLCRVWLRRHKLSTKSRMIEMSFLLW